MGLSQDPCLCFVLVQDPQLRASCSFRGAIGVLLVPSPETGHLYPWPSDRKTFYPTCRGRQVLLLPHPQNSGVFAWALGARAMLSLPQLLTGFCLRLSSLQGKAQGFLPGPQGQPPVEALSSLLPVEESLGMRAHPLVCGALGCLIPGPTQPVGMYLSWLISSTCLCDSHLLVPCHSADISHVLSLGVAGPS